MERHSRTAKRKTEKIRKGLSVIDRSPLLKPRHNETERKRDKISKRERRCGNVECDSQGGGKTSPGKRRATRGEAT